MKHFNSDDLLVDDVVLYIPCPILTRIVKKISDRTIFFHDGTTLSRTTFDISLKNEKFEITRNGSIIHPIDFPQKSHSKHV